MLLVAALLQWFKQRFDNECDSVDSQRRQAISLPASHSQPFTQKTTETSRENGKLDERKQAWESAPIQYWVKTDHQYFIYTAEYCITLTGHLTFKLALHGTSELGRFCEGTLA